MDRMTWSLWSRAIPESVTCGALGEDGHEPLDAGRGPASLELVPHDRFDDLDGRLGRDHQSTHSGTDDDLVFVGAGRHLGHVNDRATDACRPCRAGVPCPATPGDPPGAGADLASEQLFQRQA
jgi:hypothetical protein